VATRLAYQDGLRATRRGRHRHVTGTVDDPHHRVLGGPCPISRHRRSESTTGRPSSVAPLTPPRLHSRHLRAHAFRRLGTYSPSRPLSVVSGISRLSVVCRPSTALCLDRPVRDCRSCVALWHELSRRDMPRPRWMGRPFTATLDRFGHSRSVADNSCTPCTRSGHTVSSFSLKRQLG